MENKNIRPLDIGKTTKIPLSGKSSRDARIIGGEIGRRQKQKYFRIKSFALKREDENFSKLFIIHEKDDWWKMVGHSAIFFHYDVSNWINMKSKLLPDSDYDCKSEDGVVNIRDIYALDSKLVKVKINPIDIKDDYRIYNIGKKYTLADIEAFKKAHAMEWARVNKIILPKEIYPKLFISLTELLNKIYFSTKKLEPYARDIIGSQMLKVIINLVRDYSLISNGKGISRTNYLEDVSDKMSWLTSQMTVVTELKLLPLKRIYGIK